MKTLTLGSTHLHVTPIGIGLAALGRPGYINLGHSDDLNREYDTAVMETHAHTVLDTAWEVGIRYFDAARSYGRAEAFLSSWLQSREIDPASITVGSKWGYTYTADWNVRADVHEVKDHSLPVLRRQVQESRTHLGNYLKLYQIHSATLDSGVLESVEVHHELARLRDEGLVIGLSLSGPNQAGALQTAIDIEVDGRPLFQAVQATWNIFSQEVGPMLSEAHDRGMGVIVKEALANGRLTERNNDPHFTEKRRFLEQAGKQFGLLSLDALAIAVVMSQPWADVVLSGAAQVEHLKSNIKALGIFDNQTDDFRNWLPDLLALAEPPDVYWRIRAELPWN